MSNRNDKKCNFSIRGNFSRRGCCALASRFVKCNGKDDRINCPFWQGHLPVFLLQEIEEKESLKGLGALFQ